MSTLLRPDQIQQTPLNYGKYVDLENELTQEELVQFILQLRDKHIQDAKQRVSNIRLDGGAYKWIVIQSLYLHPFIS